MNKRTKRVAGVLAPTVLIVVVWYAVALTVEAVRGVDFPTPWDAALRLGALLVGDQLSGHGLYRHIGDSLLRWGIGFGVAALAGLAAGLAAGWWGAVRRVATPIFHVLQLIPGLAWIPVALLLFGVGERATISMIAITAFTPVAISVSDGVRRVDTTYVRAAQMLGSNRRSLFLHVLVPGALPSILTGLRVGLGNGWRVLVAAEMIVGTGTGLGFSIIEARWTLDYASAFACIAVICLVGLVMENIVFSRIEERTVRRWALAKDSP